MTLAEKECCCCCAEARQACLETLQMCLKKGGKCCDATLCLLLLECAQTCQICFDCCAIGSERCASLCATTAELCLKTAQCCEATGDKDMTECCKILRQCASACETVCEKRKTAKKTIA
jgi:hypothetical protein